MQEKEWGSNLINKKEEETNPFESTTIPDNIEEIREEMRQTSPQKKMMLNTTTVGGSKGSKEISDTDIKGVDYWFRRRNIEGRHILFGGISLIDELVRDREESDEIAEIISREFARWDKDIAHEITDAKLLYWLPRKFIDKFKDGINNRTDADVLPYIREFISHLYKFYEFKYPLISYPSIIGNIIMEINKLTDINAILVNVPESNVSMNALDAETQCKIMQQGIDDGVVDKFDAVTLSNVIERIEWMSSTDKLCDYTTGLSRKFKRTLKNFKKTEEGIVTWLEKLSSDEVHSYPMPSTSSDKTQIMKDFVQYIAYLLMKDHTAPYQEELNEHKEELFEDGLSEEEWFMKNGYYTSADHFRHIKSGEAYLYVLSRYFKYSKLQSDLDILELAMYLEQVCKASKFDGAKLLCTQVNDIYNILY